MDFTPFQVEACLLRVSLDLPGQRFDLFMEIAMGRSRSWRAGDNHPAHADQDGGKGVESLTLENETSHFGLTFRRGRTGGVGIARVSRRIVGSNAIRICPPSRQAGVCIG